MTVTHEQMVEAQLETGRKAMDMLESVASFGDEIAFQLNKDADIEHDEVLEVRMKAADFRGLIEMFTDVSAWVKGIVAFDSLEDINAQCSDDSK